MVKLRHSADEIARLGDALYDREVAPRVSEEDLGCFVAIDVDSGAYEIDRDELPAFDRLFARNPNAQIYLRRIGFPYAHRIRTREHEDDPSA